ncbi:S10 family peptidase [Legionella sp. km772]|uniref:S10 family peptidase n=1 Tax=Legionella sp. km772 TaxID=2498111 RepID=UPI000F8CA5BC|nr:S10 family peptidase [Legionella sp. km772]RUR06984.1 S10 family peptidase [Legionella sp. km772]
MNKKFIFVLMLLGFMSLAMSQQNSKDRIHSLPGLGKLNHLEFAGYLPLASKIRGKPGGNLFYWYVENLEQQKNAPLVLWLNGGPGAASMYGFLMENGPYSVNPDLSLKKRADSWTQKADYLIIDQPAGVGLSYGEQDSYANEDEAMDQLYHALNQFFTRYPHLKKKAFYLAGESYAGKYLPQLAMRIITGNKNNKTPIHLKGLMIGDAWVNPKVQQAANIDYAYYHGLIDEQDRPFVMKLYKDCVQEIDKQKPSSKKANRVCMKIQNFIQQQSGQLNLANIAKGVEPDDQHMIAYLNKPEVRSALHVDPRVKKFTTFSEVVADKLELGEQDSVAELYPELLKAGIKILLYNGLEDGKDSNFLSTQRWLSQLNWTYKNEFKEASRCVWFISNKKVAGYAKASHGLTLVTIRNAGHLAPIDQPEALLDLFHHFIENKTLC